MRSRPKSGAEVGRPVTSVSGVNDIDVIDLVVTYCRAHPSARKWFIIGGAVSAGAGIAAFMLGLNGVNAGAFLVGVIGFIIGVTALAGGLLSLTDYTSPLAGELRLLRAERERLLERLESSAEQPAAPADVFDRLSLALNQQEEYLTLNKAQARSSYFVGVFSIVAGLITLLGGVWLFYLRPSPNLTLTALSAVAGVLIQVIGGLALYLHRQHLQQVTYFYDHLVRLQETVIAVRLAESIADNSARDGAREKVAMALLARYFVSGFRIAPKPIRPAAAPDQTE